MKHGITEQEWLDYSEGGLDTAACDRLEIHLTACAECWEQYRQTMLAERQLRGAAERVRRRFVLSERQMHGALYDFFTRAQAAEPNAEKARQLRERLEYLEAVLAQMCGTRTAAQVLERAAEQAEAPAPTALTTEMWPDFLDHLTALAQVMCGASAASLIRETGQLEQ